MTPNELRQLPIAELQRRAESGSGKVAALCVLGERFNGAGRPDLAAEAYKTARQLDASSVQALAGIITAELGQSAPCRAEAALRQLALADPASPAPQFALAELYLSVEDLSHAEPYLREAVRQMPEDSHVCFRYGTWLALRGLRGKAIDVLTKAARLAPKVPEYRVALLDLLVMQGRHEEAATHLKVARTYLPASASLEFYQAKLLLARQGGSPSDALAATASLKKARELAPQWLAPRMLLATQAQSQGRHDDAINELEDARSAGIDNLQLLVALAQAYHRAGRAKDGREAQSAYERLQREARTMNRLMNAAVAAPKNIDAKLRLARALREKGVLLSALATFRDVLALDPNHAEASEAVHALTNS